MFRYSLLSVVLLTAASNVYASWADGMFDELTRDFGTVPRGQMQSHPFRLVNNTGQTVTISGVRVSCGCVTARALQTTLAPGQETAILAQMDTRRFYNSKQVTIYVTFNQPRFEEVRLWVQANSREDVQFNPDGLAFGAVKRGEPSDAKLNVTFLGNGNMRVTEIQSESNYVQPIIKEVRREATEVSYEISAKIRPDTPAGKWFTDIWLKTDNNSMPKLRVPVTVEVQAPLSVSPNKVSMGEVKAGTESDRKIILRGVRPFRITSIFGVDNLVKVKEASSEPKSVHVLTVTVRPQQVGELSRMIRVETDIKSGGNIEFLAQANGVP